MYNEYYITKIIPKYNETHEDKASFNRNLEQSQSLKDLKNDNDNFYNCILRNQADLDFLNREYRKKYKDDADVRYLAIKESLDHYIAYMIANEDGFLDTQEFKNYLEYIMKNNIKKPDLYDLIERNINHPYIPEDNLEFNTNVAFEYISPEILKKYYPDKFQLVLEHKAHKDEELQSLMNKVDEGLANDKSTLSSDEVILLARYFDGKKDLKDSNYEHFFRYVFNNLENMENSPELLSSILSYLPEVYGEGVNNTRSFVGNFDGRKKTDYAHSNPKGYTCFEKRICDNTILNSFETIRKSRQINDYDIASLVFVQFHELTHQKQRTYVNRRKFRWILSRIKSYS